jgi:putative oxidoreductase
MNVFMMDMVNKYGRWGRNRAAGLFFMRLSVGMVFLAHGWMKIHNIPMIEGMMVGFGMPAWVGVFIAWLEVIGGVALILGVATRIFAKLFVIEMVVAFFLTGGFGTGYRPHELELALLFGSLAILLAGSGRYSLWACECHKCGAMQCKDGKCEEQGKATI